ncbi:hypothetical protein EMIT0324P_90171 [Pseudomonas chlororaphis]
MPYFFQNHLPDSIDGIEQAAQMGLKAEARYRQLFTADEMGRRWSELYQELLEEKALSYA